MSKNIGVWAVVLAGVTGHMVGHQVVQPTVPSTQTTPQIIQSTPQAPPPTPDATQGPAPRTEAAIESIRPTYVLGSGDQIVIRAFEVEEISDKPFRIDSAGDIDLPLLGKVHAAGFTLEQLQADLVE